MAGVGVWQGVGGIGWRRGDAPTLTLPRRGRGLLVLGARGGGVWRRAGGGLYYLGAQDVLAVG